MPEIAPGHGDPLGLELGNRRGDDRCVETVEGVAAQLEQVAQCGPQLVGGRLAHGGEAPVLHQLLAPERPEVRLSVAHVDDEQHARIILTGTMPTGAPKLYVLPASHPCAAVEAALELKSLPFERVVLLPLSQLMIGPLR